MGTTKQDEITSNIKLEFDRLNDEIVKMEVEKDGLTKALEEANSRISDLQSELEEYRYMSHIINTGRDGGIQYSASNLLDQQIMEALTDLMETSNNVSLLQHLESLKKIGV